MVGGFIALLVLGEVTLGSNVQYLNYIFVTFYLIEKKISVIAHD